jgi:hypothetical protein
MIHAPFTKPVKRGRPLTSHDSRAIHQACQEGQAVTTGRFNTRSELEENVIDRHGRGWSARRIGIYAGITDRTVTSIIDKNLGARRT